MITAIVLYDLPPSIGLEECRAYFTKIAPDFFKIPGFLRKQFICARAGKVAGGVYMRESQEVAERFYSGEWLAGIRARKRIYIHINNTNPLLRPGSVERKQVEAGGWEIACDGMEVNL